MAARSSSTKGWLPLPGERAFIVGQTGSGKTTLVLHLLQSLENSPVVIYDTKDEPKFEGLPNSRLVFTSEEVDEAIDDQETDYIIFRPDIGTAADHNALDDLLLHHYENYAGVDAYIDEIADFINNGRPGVGLRALYRKGRSRGITTLAGTQRPVGVGKFPVSESQQIHLFHLNDLDDRKIISKSSGAPLLDNPPKFHHWLYRTSDPDRPPPRLIGPVSLPDGIDPGYVDPIPADTPASPTSDIGHVWIGDRRFWKLNRGD